MKKILIICLLTFKITIAQSITSNCQNEVVLALDTSGDICKYEDKRTDWLTTIKLLVSELKRSNQNISVGLYAEFYDKTRYSLRPVDLANESQASRFEAMLAHIIEKCESFALSEDQPVSLRVALDTRIDGHLTEGKKLFSADSNLSIQKHYILVSDGEIFTGPQSIALHKQFGTQDIYTYTIGIDTTINSTNEPRSLFLYLEDQFWAYLGQYYLNFASTPKSFEELKSYQNTSKDMSISLEAINIWFALLEEHKMDNELISLVANMSDKHAKLNDLSFLFFLSLDDSGYVQHAFDRDRFSLFGFKDFAITEETAQDIAHLSTEFRIKFFNSIVESSQSQLLQVKHNNLSRIASHLFGENSGEKLYFDFNQEQEQVNFKAMLHQHLSCQMIKP